MRVTRPLAFHALIGKAHCGCGACMGYCDCAGHGDAAPADRRHARGMAVGFSCTRGYKGNKRESGLSQGV
eukprot:1148169-Pelagomonas_calceolata.AAC.6